MEVRSAGSRHFILDPYPFAASSLSFRFPARHVTGKLFASAADLQRLYGAALAGNAVGHHNRQLGCARKRRFAGEEEGNGEIAVPPFPHLLVLSRRLCRVTSESAVGFRSSCSPVPVRSRLGRNRAPYLRGRKMSEERAGRRSGNR